ncbi:hypothetical protein [Xanthovirga aplysinae]|uniref:hypothetical protein n=1 Tax=Xanthovirga aplysinae TaxID=2529853 RepID=UPI0012BB793A|nr:hypothetical protein [Xanthovirga aplysinae]MTI31875.1 hypothetical protein [Xanthovirga aplysinae]
MDRLRNLIQYQFVIIFIWMGFIMGLSFLEAPLKFQAPSVTLAIGLEIGRLVFKVLNRVELAFSLSLLLYLLLFSANVRIKVLGYLIIFIVLTQSSFLLPALDERALIYISGKEIEGASPHIYYVVLEILKVLALLFLGIWQLAAHKKKYSGEVLHPHS